ncbi:PQQ-dependent sugar dehydrogenase [Mucilaginibacter pedocola]|uniref:PKD domain-containing protein n=1 Tax=Mucilaginibacter pedocola TaxID=1792845 RepID=A0A1S9PKG2_9SPHI|nr:PQQ-dependent sugar dehydrogenase [Mucilaginibacter pedocola]OOQ61425.1 PKD domain-containing protein [Mucilaginibacter pedocola]
MQHFLRKLRFRGGYVQALMVSAACLLMYSCSPNQAADDGKKPDDNRFTPIALTKTGDLDEPMNFEVLNDGRVYINERKGGLKLFDPSTNSITLVSTIPVNTKYTSAEGVVTEAEEGFIGFTIDPNFDKNHWAYLFYSHPTEKKDVLSRWELRDDKLIEGSEKVLLEIPKQREVCCHTGGGMTWDASYNLYITVGNNTGNVADKSQTDERPNRTSWDDQRGAGNTNDLRGKILRIHPEENGTYTIPEGNLFPKGTPKTRPEIYVMGDRNPWRPSVDSKTGFLYWGEVGPDASEDSKTTRAGRDELNQARKAGFFGWPYFIGENVGYPMYDYKTDKVGAPQDPAHPVNKSVNNTGLTELPTAQPAFISYPYGVSEKFPKVGTGGRCAVGGPVFHKDNFKNAKTTFPSYYEGKWIAADLTRGWIMSIKMKENGDYDSMEQFLPDYHPVEPIDIKFASNGDLYVLEYGSNWFRKSENAKLVRITYNSGNRVPVVNASANVSGGVVPLKVTLSSAGTKDFDGDELKYEWAVKDASGKTVETLKDSTSNLTLDKAGVYNVSLTVTDPSGAKNSKSLKIVAGNEPPAVALTLSSNKTMFFPGKPVVYDVKVADKEDGKVDPKQVAVSVDYVSEGFDMAVVNQQQRSVDASTRFAVAAALIAKSDCKVCHNVNSKSVGPMFTAIADKYKAKYAWALDSLPKKIRGGGGGVWGEVNMPAHPAMSLADARTITAYILGSNDKNISTLPLAGSYTEQLPAGDAGTGTMIIRAAYTDKGAGAVPALTTEKTIQLHSSQYSSGDANILHNAEKIVEAMFTVSTNIRPKNDGYFAYKNIDLTGVQQVALMATANPSQGFVGGNIEIHLDKPDGQLLGTANVAPVNPFAALMNAANAAQTKGGSKVAAPTAKGPAKKTKGPSMADFAKLMGGMATKININGASGQHDIYFVFKNAKAKPLEPLMSVSSVKFNDVKQ